MSALDPRRLGRITASAVPAILGVSAYDGPNAIERRMVRALAGAPDEVLDNEAIRHGNAHEADAIESFSNELFETVHGEQTFFIHDEGWAACTVDGLIGEDGVVEVKCPLWSKKRAPERADYIAQVRFQLFVTGRSYGYLYQWREGEDGDYIRIERDLDWEAENIPVLAEFHRSVHEIMKDEEAVAAHLGDLKVVRSDDDWSELAREYRRAKAWYEEAKAAMDAAKSALVALAGNAEQVRGGGVVLSRVQRDVSVNWSKYAKENLTSIEVPNKYLSAPSVSWRLTDDKESS